MRRSSRSWTSSDQPLVGFWLAWAGGCEHESSSTFGQACGNMFSALHRNLVQVQVSQGARMQPKHAAKGATVSTAPAAPSACHHVQQRQQRRSSPGLANSWSAAITERKVVWLGRWSMDGIERFPARGRLDLRPPPVLALTQLQYASAIRQQIATFRCAHCLTARVETESC